MPIVEIPRSLAGVGALIVTSSGLFLSVEETTTSERTVKEEGSRTPPMESTEPSEDQFTTLRRVFQEEVIPPEGFHLRYRGPLCDVIITGDTLVRMFLFESEFPFQATVGQNEKDVRNPRWLRLKDPLEHPLGNRDFRPGVRETIQAYKCLLEDPRSYRFMRFEQAVDAPIVLDRIRGGGLQNGALSQNGHLLKPGLAY